MTFDEELKLINTVYIYALKDPREPNHIRYIGKTNNPKERLRQHIKEAKRSRDKTHKHCWLRKLLAENVKPILDIIEEVVFVDKTKWEVREAFYISDFREKGHKLTNYALGGEGIRGIKLSEEHKQKLRTIGLNISEEEKERLRNLAKNMTEETKRKISNTNKGRKKSPEHIAKIQATAKANSTTRKGVKLTPEHIAKVEATKRANGTWGKGHPNSEAQRLNMSRVQTGRKHSQEQKDKRVATLRKNKQAKQELTELLKYWRL